MLVCASIAKGNLMMRIKKLNGANYFQIMLVVTLCVTNHEFIFLYFIFFFHVCTSYEYVQRSNYDVDYTTEITTATKQQQQSINNGLFTAHTLTSLHVTEEILFG